MGSKLSGEKRINVFCREPHYEIAVFIMFFTAYLFTVPNLQNLNEYTAVYYVLTYADFGFKSRLVMGSIIGLFTNYITRKAIYIIISIFTIFFIGIVSFLVGDIVRRISKNIGNSAEIFIILFVACPVSIQYLFNINNFGRFDLFSILITTVILFCIKNEKTKWLVPFLCVFAVIFNYNFVFMYMPVIAIIMIYEYLVNHNSRTHFMIFAVSCLAVAGFFIYFKVFAPESGFSSQEKLKIFLAGKTDIQGGEIPVFGDFCFPLAGIYMRDAGKSYSWFFDLLKVYGPFMFFSTVPAFAVLISFWIKALKDAQQKTKKFVFLLCLFAPIAGLPMFLAIDWDRWIPTLFISQFMLVLYILARNDERAVDALKSIVSYFNRHSLLFTVLIIYSASSIFSNNYSVYVSVMLQHIDNFLSFA